MEVFWLVFIAVVIFCVLLFWWNSKQLNRPREKWKRFSEALRRDWKE